MFKLKMLFCYVVVILLFVACDLTSVEDSVEKPVEDSTADSITLIVTDAVESAVDASITKVISPNSLSRSITGIYNINYSTTGYTVTGESTMTDSNNYLVDVNIVYDNYSSGGTIINGSSNYKASIINGVATGDYSGYFDILYNGENLTYKWDMSFEGTVYTGSYYIDDYKYTYDYDYSVTTTGEMPSQEFLEKYAIAQNNGLQGCTIDNGSTSQLGSSLGKYRNSDSTVLLESYASINTVDYTPIAAYSSYSFDGYVDDNGVSIDGSFRFDMDYHGSSTDYSYTYVGSIVYKYKAETYTYEYDYEYDLKDGVYTYSGYMKINGYTYEYSSNGTIQYN